MRRRARVVEWVRLESENSRKAIRGSNPLASAIDKIFASSPCHATWRPIE